MTANNLILLCLLVSVTSSAEISQIIREAAQTGAWLNKGLVYPRCSEPHFQRLHCSNFSLTQSPVAKDKLWQPDCDYLMRRIVCTLYTLACPSSGDSSFQMYDIPCQAACYATVDICGMQASRLVPPRSVISAENPKKPEQQQTWQGLSKRSDAHPSQLPAYPSLYPGAPNTQHNSQVDSPGKSVWPWRPYQPQRTRRSSSTSNMRQIPVPSQTLLPQKAEKSDCGFLPAGGCDNWARDMLNIHRYYRKNVESEIKHNPACPRNLVETCNKMFPTEFTKEDWRMGNFTVALVMQISQTFWWFGNHDRFQPFFRYNVKQTLKTDIVAYDEKVILTNGWPLGCVCPNKLVVGKKYLVLTHSKLSRQTLRISTKTVFLGKVKRFKKRIHCWLGSCSGTSTTDNRQNNYNQRRWYWQGPRRQ